MWASKRNEDGDFIKKAPPLPPASPRPPRSGSPAGHVPRVLRGRDCHVACSAPRHAYVNAPRVACCYQAEYQVLSGKIRDLAWDGESKRLLVVGEGKDRQAKQTREATQHT